MYDLAPTKLKVVPLNRETLQERVYRQICDLILDGEIVPGQLVTIQAMADAFGVSHMPVREARKIAQEFPGIELWETNIDAMCMWLVKNPQDYGVLVASNMFGDIISDLCAQLVGGLGFACSGNIGKEVAVFEPSHGSAPKYVGMNKVNPIAMILSAKMMLDHLGELDMAKRLEDAVAAVIAEGKVRTYDMGGANTTTEMAEAIAARC